MLERLKTSDALARLGWKMATPIPNLQVESEIQNDPDNSKLPTENQNSNLVLPSGIDLANEVLDLRDLTERYWRVIQAQHVRIARLESELACAKTAKP
jgi:hypothetical protein